MSATNLKSKRNPLVRAIQLILWSDLGPVVALFVILILFTLADNLWGSGRFLSMRNARVMLNSASLVAVPALGMTIIIIAGGIDLSAGTALTLCATALAILLKNDVSYMAAVPVVLLVGCACGAANGTIISTLRVVPFIVTLGSMTIYLGIGQILSGESTVFPPRENIPAWLIDLCSTGKPDVYYGWLPNIPRSVLFALVLACFVAVLLRYTVFGRSVFAIGSNESTARLCGINIPLTKILVYTIAGFFVAVGGVYHFANIKNGNPSEGVGLELQVIAAVVVGGGSLSGGRGSVLGTVTGAMIMAAIRSGCDQLSIPNPYQLIIIGAIIVIAVTMDRLREGSPEWLFRWLQSRSP
ncbi:MAG: ABC transporter permease [Pirellulaceae bacterium]|nr:ABC transporter permease [Planctomycetales bacterium]